MLSIRMQRTGRKGHAMFRLVVQESRLAPTSGKVVAALGSYDPHAKVAAIDKEKAALYLKNGAQPSDRAVRLLQSEGLKMPGWVQTSGSKTGKLRNPEKLRRNQPKEAPAAEPVAEKDSQPAPEKSDEAVTEVE